jgi:hypothetical protein
MIKFLIIYFSVIVLTNAQTNFINTSQKWIYGVLSGVALSLLGFVAAAFLVWIRSSSKSTKFKLILQFFYALACGSLIGDAVIHIIS